MIKKIVVSLSLFLAFCSFSQEATSSPYSFYGIGEMKFKGNVENRSIGGLSVFRDSIHLNLLNPASYAGLKTTTFTVGGNSNISTISSFNKQAETKRTSIDYIALAMPIYKNFGVSLGLLPVSTVGYRIVSENPNSQIRDKVNEGSGGVNKVFLGAGLNILPELSIGANLDFSFGKITSNNTTRFSNVQYGTREFINSKVNGTSFSTGLMYESKFKTKTQISAGFTFSPEYNLSFTTDRLIANIPNLSESQNENFDFIQFPVNEYIIKMPSKISFGLGFGQARKWQFGSEIILQNKNDFAGQYKLNPNISFEKTTQLKLGGYYIPKYNSFKSYFDRIIYRAGFNYQNLGMVINGKSITEQTITTGLGLPLNGVFSNINIGFEFGKRGTKLAGLVQENFKILTIGLSLNDIWFKRRKFD